MLGEERDFEGIVIEHLLRVIFPPRHLGLIVDVHEPREAFHFFSIQVNMDLPFVSKRGNLGVVEGYFLAFIPLLGWSWVGYSEESGLVSLIANVGLGREKGTGQVH